MGHLGVQFASRFGYKVAAIGRGSENASLAKKLGAHIYIDSQATNAAQELQRLGGASVIIATAPNSKAMSALINGLGPNGKLVEVGAAPDSIEVTPSQLIFGSKTIQGWAAGTPAASEDTLKFCDLTASTGKQCRWATGFGGGDVVYPDRAEEDRKLVVYTSDPFQKVPNFNAPSRLERFAADCGVSFTLLGPRGTLPCRSASVRRLRPSFRGDRFRSWGARQSAPTSSESLAFASDGAARAAFC